MKKIPAFRLTVQISAAVIIGSSLYTAPEFMKPLFLAIMFLGGAFYCGWICPFGFLQDLGSRLGKHLRIQKRKVPQSLHRTLLYGRYILASAAALLVSDTLFMLLGYEPRGTALGLLTGHLPSVIAFVVLAGFTGLSVVYERPYCRYFCIEGAKYGTASLFRIFTVQRNPQACVQCGKCDKACPMQIQVTKVENLRSPQCINCLECVAACPIKGALSYGMIPKAGHSKSNTDKRTDPLTAKKRKSA